MHQSVSLTYYKSLTLQVLSYHTSAPSDEVSKIKVSVVSSVVCTKMLFVMFAEMKKIDLNIFVSYYVKINMPLSNGFH